MFKSARKVQGRGATPAKLLLGVAASACLVPATAQAKSVFIPIMPASASVLTCLPAAPEAAPSTPTGQLVIPTRSAAILGGQPSALDLIRMEQQAHAAATEMPVATSTANNTSIVAPATCGVPTMSFSFIDTASVAPRVEIPVAPAVASTDFLGSGRIGIGTTPFSSDWERVSGSGLSARRVSNLLGARADISVETLTLVNSWANRRIDFVDDAALYGDRDYWATARETLAIGRGDCEDFAILKYQMLSALGFDESDMYLTLARDLVRNADHAVLIVRINGQHYMLDSATDELLLADRSHDYRATMSFNSESAWLHGYTARPQPQPATLAYLSDSAVSNARVTGLSK